MVGIVNEPKPEGTAFLLSWLQGRVDLKPTIPVGRPRVGIRIQQVIHHEHLALNFAGVVVGTSRVVESGPAYQDVTLWVYRLALGIEELVPDILVLPASVWVEVKAAAVEVDRRLEVLPVAEAAGGVADPLDLRVQALGRRVGDPVSQVGEDVRQVRLEHARLLDHGLEPRVGRPEVPVVEEPAGGSDVTVLPEVRGRLLERPGAGDLERAVA